VSLSLTVCGVGTSTNISLALSLAAAPQKVTYSLLTDTPIAVSVFFQLLDSAVVSVVWTLL